jgi:hypothetical protein
MDDFSALEQHRPQLLAARAAALAGAAGESIIAALDWAVRAIDAALDGATSLEAARYAVTTALEQVGAWQREHEARPRRRPRGFLFWRD